MLALLFRQVNLRHAGIINRCWLYCLGRSISLRYNKQMLALLFRQVNLSHQVINRCWLYCLGRSISHQVINRCWLYCLGRSISLRYNKQMLALLFRQVNLPQV